MMDHGVLQSHASSTASLTYVRASQLPGGRPCNRSPSCQAQRPGDGALAVRGLQLGWQHQHLQHRQRLKPVPVISNDLRSEAERFVASLDAGVALEGDADAAEEAMQAQLREQLAGMKAEEGKLQAQIDALYNATFGKRTVQMPLEEAGQEAAAPPAAATGAEPAAPAAPAMESVSFGSMDELRFQDLGRDQPAAAAALMAAAEAADANAWRSFQGQARTLKMQRSRLQQEASELEGAVLAAERAAAKFRLSVAAAEAEAAGGLAGSGGAVPVAPARSEGPFGWGARSAAGAPAPPARIVLLTGFESFNVQLYKQAAQVLKRQMPNVTLQVFSDRDLATEAGKAQVEAALAHADIFFGSLLFDYDQVEWLRARTERIPTRLVFESALELMSTTKVRSFVMGATGGGSGGAGGAPAKAPGPPAPVKKLLSMFGSGREEDKMVGYLSFLKLGPKLLKWVPGQKAADLRTWLTAYAYWNQGGVRNVVAMFAYLVEALVAARGYVPPPPVETPALGCLHPQYTEGYFSSPAEYMRWYARNGPLRASPDAPVVALLLYRKHVVTEQPYIGQLVAQMEAEGVLPLPIFINGVEAHTVVRDLLTSDHEQQLIKRGDTANVSSTLKKDAVRVDVVLSTIGFPLVGGPAGTMEGGRQAEVAKAILSAKALPYVVAAPLLIQDMESWCRDGIAGLQSVVLYSLPELDGAIDTVPLGGLVGDNIFLVPERVKKVAARIRRWVALRRKPAAQRRLAVLLYGFPPGVGAVGTAALLNVPKSLENLLAALRKEGYDLGPNVPEDLTGLGEALVAQLRKQTEDSRARSKGAKGINALGAGDAASYGVVPAAAEMTGLRLRELLTYPPEWGPSEWGPLPFLPDNDVLVSRMEKQWGNLRLYRGLNTSLTGALQVPGLSLGSVWVGVQPPLGIEGDPMRLLFERDLTPHPQYAAFYKWLQHEYQADVLLHFGMHGTVEWLPGAPLGNTGLSWSDVLLGELPNVYVYAANNPSESIIAKRRGYGTIISHNVPPYGRAGLYKQLSSLRELLQEYREAKQAAPGASSAEGLRASPAWALVGTMIDSVNAAGLQEDCPFLEPSTGQARALMAEDVPSLDPLAVDAWASRLYAYLQVLEGRLFSEGLHVLGAAPGPQQMAQYLEAYFGAGLPKEAVTAVAEHGEEGAASVRSRLEQLWQQEAASPLEPAAPSTPLSAPAPAAPAPAAAAPAAPPTREELEGRLAEALKIRGLLQRNTEELGGALTALRGEYVLPEAGGDLLRDGSGVLPTGRNIHALDPYRMPSPAAMTRGSAVAAAILEQHRKTSADGQYPETVAVNLWGLDSIKSKGESVGIVLALVGARPVREGTGRVARFELVPLSELGRPRIDVLCNMSGIFRDSFQNVVELLDDLFRRAAEAPEEPPESNLIKKHALAMAGKGLSNSSARLFSNPAGDYGSMVNERVGTGAWEDGDELGDTWADRNAFSYGRGRERGTARPEVLRTLLATTDRIVQQVDSVEYGLTDIQEYYANTGALKRAAEVARKRSGVSAKVGCSIVEAFGGAGGGGSSSVPPPRELDEVLRIEYRTKLLNPRWAQAMASQGSGGAYEISTRMTSMVGWGATTNFAEDWVWDQAADTYVEDKDMAATLRKNNPQAFSNVLRRFIEAASRGMWNAKPEQLEKLKQMYSDLDDELEGIK